MSINQTARPATSATMAALSLLTSATPKIGATAPKSYVKPKS
jgi:hypothetical protein